VLHATAASSSEGRPALAPGFHVRRFGTDRHLPTSRPIRKYWSLPEAWSGQRSSNQLKLQLAFNRHLVKPGRIRHNDIRTMCGL
jgi:hypothetical protein